MYAKLRAVLASPHSSAADKALARAGVLHFARESLLGPQQLHSVGYVHRDLKSSNMLVDERYRVLLTDLGSATPIGSIWCVLLNRFSPAYAVRLT